MFRKNFGKWGMFRKLHLIPHRLTFMEKCVSLHNQFYHFILKIKPGAHFAWGRCGNLPNPGNSFLFFTDKSYQL
jgi:hypothetical protein